MHCECLSCTIKLKKIILYIRYRLEKSDATVHRTKSNSPASLILSYPFLLQPHKLSQASGPNASPSHAPPSQALPLPRAHLELWNRGSIALALRHAHTTGVRHLKNIEQTPDSCRSTQPSEVAGEGTSPVPFPSHSSRTRPIATCPRPLQPSLCPLVLLPAPPQDAPLAMWQAPHAAHKAGDTRGRPRELRGGGARGLRRAPRGRQRASGQRREIRGRRRRRSAMVLP